VERLTGSIRRELPGHVIVWNEQLLHRLITSCISYYHHCRPHMSLDGNAPVPREVEPPNKRRVIAIPLVGRLQRRYSHYT
jgi:hypothetical protein